MFFCHGTLPADLAAGLPLLVKWPPEPVNSAAAVRRGKYRLCAAVLHKTTKTVPAVSDVKRPRLPLLRSPGKRGSL